MVKKTVFVSIALVVALSIMVLVFTIPGATSATDQKGLVRTAVEKAEPIYQKLKEIIAEEIESFNIEDDSDPDLDEAREGLEEMKGYTEQLDGLISSLSGLSDDPSKNDGKTVRAAREYLTMLRNMTSDLSELIVYSIDLYEAILLMDAMDADTDDYEMLAQEIWNATDATKKALEQIKPPSYLAITHRDLIARVTEFREFAVDFSYAGQLGDPLRIYSCVYRMGRIVRMFESCGENLNADMELQFKQAERRMNGSIAKIHDELTRNLAALKNA